MLSSVLKSRRAIRVNIRIMRTFTRLRNLVSGHSELALKLSELEGRIQTHDQHIQSLFQAIHNLMAPPEDPPREIGFKAE